MKTFLTMMTLSLLAAAGLLAADQPSATYPLTTCVVSGEKLGEMGKPYVFTYEGTTVELCCKSCQKQFEKDPATYIKKIQAAQKGS